MPTSRIDSRFSDPAADAATWAEASGALERAELFWLTTVRADGRPHVTPLVGVAFDGAMHFCTGLREQKARNLEHSPLVALTTGVNTWARGMDVVVEGTAVRITDRATLQALADAYVAKYGSDWMFEVEQDGFRSEEGGPAAVFRIEPSKVMVFAKEPHAQTTIRF
jgi:general stress protein 26